MTRARDLAAGTFELATGGVLKLETSDTTVTDGSVLGKIEFKAPDEASGTDAILVGAAIEAVAEGTFAADNNATELVFKTGASGAADQKMTLTSGGNVGIGVAPADSNSFGKALDVGSATGAALYLRDVDSSKVGIVGQFNEQLSINSKQSNGNIGFYTGASNTQRMLVDSSGNLLVGMTSASTNNDGAGIRADGLIHGKRTGVVAVFNQKGNDGVVVEISNDNTVVGSIGTNSNGNFQLFGTAASHVGLQFGSPSILPINNSGASSNGAVDLGDANVRFKDLYLSGGVVFGPASASTVSSQTLDSYEEGTFTAGFSGCSFSAIGNTTGIYTKVGDLVTWNYYSASANLINASGLAKFTGLPFTVRNTTSGYVPFSTTHNTFFGGSTTAGVTGYHGINSTECIFINIGSTGGTSFVNGNQKTIMIGGAYFTDS